MDDLKIIGITGGIGTGKSLVCRIFESMGVQVYDADSRAKYLINNDKTIKEGLINLFGPDVYQNGQYNRDLVSQRIFQDKHLLDSLNNIVHPAVGNDFKDWCKKHSEAPFLLKEAALLVENGTYKDLDGLIVVDASKEIRIKRIEKRDTHRTKADIEKIIELQLPQTDKLKVADFVIDNNDDEFVILQVENIFNKITKK